MKKTNHITIVSSDLDYWIAEWLKGDRRSSLCTREAYRRDMTQFFARCVKSFDQVTVPDILDYQSSLPDKYATKTKARKLATVRSFYRFLNNREVTNLNLARIEGVRIQQTVKRDDLLTEKEVRALVDAAKGTEYQLFVRFLYLTAVRVSEALALRLRDFNNLGEAGAEAHITGKGGKQRDVWIPGELWFDLLSSQYLYHKANDERIFDTIATRFDALRIIKGLAKTAKIDKRVSPHSLRHAHISHALKNGATLAELRDQAGHANISTTSLYAHADHTRATATRLKVQ